jgi:hypothetical protein
MRLSLDRGRGLADGGGSATVEVPCALRFAGVCRDERIHRAAGVTIWFCGEEMTW